MAKYKKKRARELQHDRFRDTTMGFFDRLGKRWKEKDAPSSIVWAESFWPASWFWSS